MAINKTIREKAYAKVNLGLDVLRKREDGYHEVKMVMQTIGICDELIISTSADTVGVNLLADVDGRKARLALAQDGHVLFPDSSGAADGRL